MTDTPPDYSKLCPEELWDCWMWVDDRAWPDRAIELYKRVYAQQPQRVEVSTGNAISSFFKLIFGRGGFGHWALDMEIRHMDAELRLKKLRVEKLIAEREASRGK